MLYVDIHTELVLRPTSKYSLKNSGFGLIEVLITAAILGLGLLGIASLQNRAIQSVKEGDNLATAALIASDVAERMLTNPYMTAQGRSGYLALDLTSDISNAGGVVAWANSVTTNSPNILRCYPADNTISCVAPGGNINVNADHVTALTNMMTLDQVEMRLLAANSLPDGEIKICFDTSSPYTNWNCNNVASRVTARNENVFTVKVRWTNIFTNSTQQYTMQFTAQCTLANSNGCT